MKNYKKHSSASDIDLRIPYICNDIKLNWYEFKRQDATNIIIKCFVLRLVIRLPIL